MDVPRREIKDKIKLKKALQPLNYLYTKTYPNPDSIWEKLALKTGIYRSFGKMPQIGEYIAQY